jgi:hypothetical protein
MLQLKNRNDELVMLVLQDNEAQTLRLIAADEYIAQMLPINNDDFLPLLSDKLQQVIQEQIDRDLLDIFKNIRELHFKANDNHYSYKIVRELPQGKHHVFRIILLPSEKKTYELIAAFKQNMEGYLTVDVGSQLPDVSSMQQFVQLAHNYVLSNQMNIAFVYGKIERSSVEVQSLIGQAIRRNLRQDDIVGLISEHDIGIILIDVNSLSLNLAINRIRLSLRNDISLRNQFRDFNVNFAGIPISANQEASQIIQSTKKLIK